jgi:hypothetical protein
MPTESEYGDDPTHISLSVYVSRIVTVLRLGIACEEFRNLFML